jgi:hypothetical protein
MSDYALGATIHIKFTTRSFSTGVPTQLAGTPSISIYPGDSTTQLGPATVASPAAGITPVIDFDSVTGLNHVTIVATSGNGYAANTDYAVMISAGTVGGVSVAGEVVGSFSLDKSAAAVDLANATDGLGAIKTDTAAILVDTGTTLDAKIDVIDGIVDSILADTAELQADWVNGGRLDLILDARASQTSVDDLPTNAELATALGTADDAVLAAVATTDGKVDAIKAKTDSLTFTKAGEVDSNLQSVNGVTVNGDGAGTPMGV